MDSTDNFTAFRISYLARTLLRSAYYVYLVYCDICDPAYSHSVMSGQSGISIACLLLLVQLPLILAQDSCRYSYLPYYATYNWPNCLLQRLPSNLSGTFYIRPEGSKVRVAYLST